MKKNQFLQYASLALAACTLILQTLAVLLQYDSGSNYFQGKAILPTIALITALLAAALGTAFAIVTKIDASAAEIFPRSTFLPSAILMGGFATSAGLLFLHIIKNGASKIATLTVVFSVLAAFYALATAYPKLREQANAITVLGFSAPLACILFNAYYYFDTSIEMNSPIKTATQVGLLCAMLYFTTELRFLMGKPMPRVFLMLASWTCALGALSAIAIPVACITGECSRLDYVAGAILTLCIMVTAGMRVQALMHSAQPTAPDFENADI
jgi:hypothetical protein